MSQWPYNMVAQDRPVLHFYRSRDVNEPKRGTPGSAGWDICLPNDFESELMVGGVKYDVKFLHLSPGEQAVIPTGIHVKFPDDYALVAFNKSGIATKRRALVGACVIDVDYQGQIHVNLHNVGTEAWKIERGDKLTQFLLLRVGLGESMEADSLEALYGGQETQRGTGAMGSTGR